MPVATSQFVILLHGLWMHSASWHNWIRLFYKRGHVAYAPEWPGEFRTVEQTRQNADALVNCGIAEVTEHFSKMISALPSTPIVIGHGCGGLIAQRLLDTGFASACVAIAPLQARQVPHLLLAQLEPGRQAPRKARFSTSTYAHTPGTFHQYVANGISRDESDWLFQSYAVPAPRQPILEVAYAKLVPVNPAAAVDERGPLQLIAGDLDIMAPTSGVRSAYDLRRRSNRFTELTIFQDCGHSLHVDRNWRMVTEAAFDFLAGNGLL